MKRYDLVIIGAGMIGLAHAWHAAQAGLSVAVVERSGAADGASVRNFGMLAIVAQKPGPELDSARAALEAWQQIAAGAGISMRRAGCLFAARIPEEMQVLEECASAQGHAFELVSGADLSHRAGVPLRADLLGGIWSPDAWKVDQRQAMAKMAAWLQRAHGVTFHFDTEARAIARNIVETATGAIHADHVIVCAGDEFATLLPEAFAASGVTRCRLQMLRTVPQPAAWRLDPFLLGGLSMTRYSVFADCPGLPALKAHQQARQAACLSNGIHVIACQEDDGSLTIGDSHHYGDGAGPARSEEVDQLLLGELAALAALPEPEIAKRWIGCYAHLPGESALVLHPLDGVTAVTLTNGQGMTHGLSVARGVIGTLFGSG